MADPFDVYLDSAYVPPDGAFDVRLWPPGPHETGGVTIIYRTGGMVSIGHVAAVVVGDARPQGGTGGEGGPGGGALGDMRTSGGPVADGVSGATVAAFANVTGGHTTDAHLSARTLVTWRADGGAALQMFLGGSGAGVEAVPEEPEPLVVPGSGGGAAVRNVIHTHPYSPRSPRSPGSARSARSGMSARSGRSSRSSRSRYS